MSFVQDYAEVIKQRKERISKEVLTYCVTVDSLYHQGLTKVYAELNGESFLNRNWQSLAIKLLREPPTIREIERLSKKKNPSLRLLRTWLSQLDVERTFETLISAMVECKLYSACDELLNFVDIFNPLEPTHSRMKCENLDDIVSIEEKNEQARHTPSPVNPTSRRRRNFRSISVDESLFARFRRKITTPFRRQISSAARIPTQYPTPPEEPPLPLPTPPQDEIFVVSSNADNQTTAMKDLMSFVYRLKPVMRGELHVRTIHDLDQQGKVTTMWLEERVARAKYVILCFSHIMKEIADCVSSYSWNSGYSLSQTEYNLKYTLEFLVTGRIYENLCRNVDGKFVPLVLHGHGMSTIITPLRYFLYFTWPNDVKLISKYIMNEPEYPIPELGPRKPLIVRELCA